MTINKISLIVIATLMGFFFFSALAIAIDGISDRVHPCDVAIIYGSKANPDGTASARLASRLNKAIQLYQQGLFNHIIVSGGTGKEGVDEATVMKNYLIAHQIPASDIITDSRGSNTEATAKNSVQLMNAYHFKNALIISQYFHISRARLALKQQGLSNIYNAHANYFESRDIYSLSREVFGYYYYLFHYR